MEAEIAAWRAREDVPSRLRWAHLAEQLADSRPGTLPSMDPSSFDVENPYAVDSWTAAWEISSSDQLCVGSEAFARAREAGEDYLSLRKRQNTQWARDTIQAGNKHLRQKDFEKAIRAYNQAIDICPDSADAYVARGCAHANHGKFAEGVADLKKALKLDPDHPNAKKYLDTILRDTGYREVKEDAAPKDDPANAGGSKGRESGHDFVFDAEELVATHGRLDAAPEEDRYSSRKKHKSRKHRDRSKDRKSKGHSQHRSGRRSSDTEEGNDRVGEKRHRSRERDRSRSRRRSRDDGDRHSSQRRRSGDRDRDRDRGSKMNRSQSSQPRPRSHGRDHDGRRIAGDEDHGSRGNESPASSDYVPERPPSR